ncbi:MAG: glycoside hydrolase family 3 C-terminal domain-containing protein, partial [Bacteroidetes bacterium]|nr:glycoside hydrolase family 3 C-terminal domain-containing protein [Bacteroidota bacterium]
AKSMVLLKNNNNLLPLKKDLGGIFVCGPMATHAQALLANYFGVSENLVTFLEGITGKVSPHTAVQYSQGALMDMPNRNPIDWFSGTGSEVDVTIACIGISQLIEGEEGESIASDNKGDRKDLKLPQNQIDFLKKMRSTSKNLVAVVTAGSAVAMDEIYEIADAVVYAWYPGEQGGNALADVLFGDVTPSGRLPVTFPYSVDDLPPFEDYALKNRTYRYVEKEPMLPFGFGLSYTTFEYSNLVLSSNKIKNGESIEAKVTVTNTGKVKGDEVVQLYITDEKGSVELPKMALKGFKRISLWAGQSREVSFTITPEMMQMVDENGNRLVEPGDFAVSIGGSAPMKRSLDLGASKPAKTTFSVKGK